MNAAACAHNGPLNEPAQQTFRRLPLLTRVTQANGQTTYWRSLNISEGGIFVCAAPTLLPGTLIDIGFCLPESALEISVRAQVVWRNDANTPEYDHSKPFGMGLRFLELAPETQRTIHRYIMMRTPAVA